MEKMEVWKALVQGQIDQVIRYATPKWYNGFRKMELNTLPALEDLVVPDWRVQGIIGKAPEDEFWYRLSKGIFNVNMRLRSKDELHYLEERDYFHDTFGHLPILWDKQYTDYVKGLGIFAMHMQDTDEARRALSNLYWFTSEFGLVQEGGQTRAYGAGILSSIDELKFAMSSRKSTVMLEDSGTLAALAAESSYVTDGFQTFYVVLPSWNSLGMILKFLWENYSK